MIRWSFFVLASCAACAPAAPLQAHATFGVADWLRLASRSNCTTHQQLESPADPNGTEDWFVACDAHRATLSRTTIDAKTREGYTEVYPLEEAVFLSIWQSAIATVTPAQCQTREQAQRTPRTFAKGLSFDDRALSEQRSALGCAVTPASQPSVDAIHDAFERLRQRGPHPLPRCTDMSLQTPPCIVRDL